MANNVRKRIDQLKVKNGFEYDSDIVGAIYDFKKSRGDLKKITRYTYVENNKGSFSQCFSGARKFKLEDYLAVEYVLNTSMAYILEGKGDVPSDFEPKGIRYAAFTDTIGNYEMLINDNILNSSDEYNKMLIDYMIEYKSKEGFKYFAEHNLLPLTDTGGRGLSTNMLYYNNDNKKLLITLCELLPINLLINYFNGFLDYDVIIFSAIDDRRNTSFTEEVVAEAIKRADLRKELATTKKINLDSYNRNVRRKNGSQYGDGLFVNYGVTVMIKYSLTHEVNDNIRVELLKNALLMNDEVYKTASTYSEEELQIDKYGFITNRYSQIFFGSVVIPVEATVELSPDTQDLLNQLNRQVHDFHEIIANHSTVSVYDNEILADKNSNEDYYRFFRLMNDKEVKIVPLYRGEKSKDKDMFEVSDSEKSVISNGTERDVNKIIKSLKVIDDISLSELKDKVYYLINPSIYMLDYEVNYIMPKDVIVSNKYSNLIRCINDNAKFLFIDYRIELKNKQFIQLIKTYGITKEELGEFLDSFITVSEVFARSLDKSTESGKELALITLKNKSWIEIYRQDIIKQF